MNHPRSRAGIGRTEIGIGVAIVLVAAIIVVPLLGGTSAESRRAEVPLNVDGIRTAEIEHHKAFKEYRSAKPAPRAPAALGASGIAWGDPADFVDLGWEPENTEEVWGSYSVQANKTGFTVQGQIDADGDGRRAVFSATEAQNAERSSAEDVY